MHRPCRSSHTAGTVAFLILLGILTQLAPLRADQVLIPAGSVWRYLDNGSDPGTAWRATAFNDSPWAWGPAKLGYGNGDEVTTVGYGPTASDKYVTTYFRKPFSLSDASAFTGLKLRVLRDDGVVVYLNGTEIFRNNLPTGVITSTTLALSGVSAAEESTVFLSSSPTTEALVTGDNVIAVEIHQVSRGSSDISFDLELIGASLDQPTVIRGPYLQMATPTSMTLRWRTSLAIESRVRYGTNLANLDGVVSSGSPTTEHSVRLTGLTPNTLYYYAVGSPAGDLAAGSEFFFYTPPPARAVQPMRFWVLGDAGTGTAAQAAVRNAFYNFAGTRYTDLVLLLGDNAYTTGTDEEYQAKFFTIYPAILRSTPSFSTVGNHDTAYQTAPNVATMPYFQIFNHPTAGEGGGVASGTEKYYSFDYGNVHFVCLDSMSSSASPGGAMLNWLAQDLAQNSADWLIAYFHHPPYTKGSHNSDTEAPLILMRENALPILEANGVDLVLSGHSHSYERSYLIDGHYGPSSSLTAGMKLNGGDGGESGTGAYEKAATGPAAHEGAVYVVSGSAGKISSGPLNHPAMFISLNQLGSFVLDVNNQRLDARFITDTGATNDWFTLVKGGAVNLPPSITMTSPAGGSSVAESSPLTLTASVLDSDGFVTSVAFYANGSLVGTDTTAPYSVVWSGALAGAHVLTAVATDDDGAQTTSAPVSVTAKPALPAPPSMALATSPSAGLVVLEWADNSSNETSFSIHRSENGVDWVGVAAVGANITTVGNRTGLVSGKTYHYRVRAWNSVGSSAFAYAPPVMVKGAPPAEVTEASANVPPSITMTSPAGGSSVAEASALTLTASVLDSDGFVTSVAFHANGSLVGTDTTAPYSVVWSGALAGAHVLTAVATDDGGAQTTSAPVSVTAKPALPAPPSLAVATSPSAGLAVLEWADNSINETSFSIHRSENGVDWVGVTAVGANITTIGNRTGLVSGRTYHYRVRAWNGVGFSAFAYAPPVVVK